jgi:hypothetical protein
MPRVRRPSSPAPHSYSLLTCLLQKRTTICLTAESGKFSSIPLSSSSPLTPFLLCSGFGSAANGTLTGRGMGGGLYGQKAFVSVLSSFPRRLTTISVLDTAARKRWNRQRWRKARESQTANFTSASLGKANRNRNDVEKKISLRARTRDTEQ